MIPKHVPGGNHPYTTAAAALSHQQQQQLQHITQAAHGNTTTPNGPLLAHHVHSKMLVSNQ